MPGHRQRAADERAASLPPGDIGPKRQKARRHVSRVVHPAAPERARHFAEGPRSRRPGPDDEGALARPQDDCGPVIPAIDRIAVIAHVPVVLGLERLHGHRGLRVAQFVIGDAGGDSFRLPSRPDPMAKLDLRLQQLRQLRRVLVTFIELLVFVLDVPATRRFVAVTGRTVSGPAVSGPTVAEVPLVAGPRLVHVREREEDLAIELTRHLA